MSTHEIEDVLSSIRRLVSEDLRPAAKADPQPAAATPAAPAADKLLLTPAFRVVSGDEEGQADAEASELTAEEDVLPPASDPASDPAEALVDSIQEAVVEETASDVMQDVVARLGAAVGQGDEEWESPVGDPPAWESAPADEAPRSVNRLHFQPTQDDSTDDFLEPATDAFAAQEPEAFDAEPYAEVEEIAESVVAPRRVVTPPSDGWADQAEAEVRASLENDTQDEAAPEDASMFAGAEMTFDEEVLRDLVRDIIREELAGTLGERITRNVRKLVRTEIARALAVREFE